MTSEKNESYVGAVLCDLFSLHPDIALACTQKYVTFELDGDNVVVCDKNGQPMKIKPIEKEAEREAKFDAADLRYIPSQSGELDSVLIFSNLVGIIA